MPYYMIERQPVFLYFAAWQRLREKALREKDLLWRASSTMARTKEAVEADQLGVRWLQERHRDDPEAFRREWVCFDLAGDEASRDTWDLLYDYCHLYGFAFLSDMRDFGQVAADDWAGESYTYPMGKAFKMNYRTSPRSWWKKLLSPEIDSAVSVIIDTAKVRRLQGTLSDFVFQTDGLTMWCTHRGVTMLPG